MQLKASGNIRSTLDITLEKPVQGFAKDNEVRLLNMVLLQYLRIVIKQECLENMVEKTRWML